MEVDSHNNNNNKQLDEKTNEEEEDLRWIPVRLRKKMKLEEIKSSLSTREKNVVEEEPEVTYTAGPKANVSIFDTVREEVEQKQNEDITARILEEEQQLLQSMTQDIPLQSVSNRAKGLVYTEPLKTSWKPPKGILERSEEFNESLRKKYKISVEGENIPPPIERFEFFKFPKCILKHLESKGIHKPSPIQMQGLPVVLSGRDMIGVAHTGSGKTLVFTLPMVLFALEEEMKLPVKPKEGPFCLILCPSRELAVQTYENIMDMAYALRDDGYPLINTVLLIGGQKLRDQEERLKEGVHIIVATPGRLLHFLSEKKTTLFFCKYLCMDEADRLIDLGFEEEIRSVLDYINQQHQTILFSATMPKTIQTFAKSALVQSIEVNVGRAGAASLNVLQEVELVSQESRMVYLLECLKKTPPPVLIFAENKADVDDIHEYLLLKGVDAVSIHGGKDQDERDFSIKMFKSGRKDVLIATDVASKGLDFPNIQHVINFDMPKEIENYIHRIGRTGRGGKTGVATTFINRSCSTTILLDLLNVLIEAKQRIPVFLQELEQLQAKQKEIEEKTGIKGCSFCGGLGHRISNCPKAESAKLKQMRSNSLMLGRESGYRSNYGEY